MTKLLHLLAALGALVVFSLPTAATAQEESLSPLVELPPKSLAQWYKPQNKRQVWLHKMFRLRQSMQAIDYYLEAGDEEALKRWAKTLQDTYAKLPEMVPEWENATRQGVAQSLYQAAESGNFKKVAKERQRLQRFCDGCHMEWQPLVNALYRSPDYRKVMVEVGDKKIDYPAMMEQVSATLGVLKITREDGDMATARKAATQLRQELQQLGGSCQQCHRNPSSFEQILGKEVQQEFDKLQSALTTPHDPKKSGRPLGMIGFKVCGRCHSLHRTLGDLRNWVSE